MRTKFFLTAAFVAYFGFDTFAGKEIKTRNSCNYTIGDCWRYKAHARVSKLGWPSTDNDRDCPAPNSCVQGDGIAYASTANKCATQWASNVWGSTSHGGSVFNTPRICSRGHILSDLTYAMGSEDPGFSPDFERSHGSSGQIDFMADKVVIPNII